MTYPGRWLITTSFLVWALCALLVVVYLAPWGVSDLDCELAPGTSVFGDATRSWLAPGVTCTWTDLNGVQHVDRPPMARMVVVALAAVGPIASLHLRRLLRADATDRVLTDARR